MSATGGGGGGGGDSSSSSDASSLIVIIMDVSPLAWGEHDLIRKHQDQARVAAGKRSAGPAILEELIESVQAFVSAAIAIDRAAGIVVTGVADNHTAVMYPRKNYLHEWITDIESTNRPDTRRLRHDITLGVAELVARSRQSCSAASGAAEPGAGAAPASSSANQTEQQQQQQQQQRGNDFRQASMASALSQALCLIHRFQVATKLGGNAYQALAGGHEHYLNRTDDDGVLALIGGGSSDGGKKKGKKGSASGSQRHASSWSPRVLMIQVSDDRARDYNALMNCAFAAMKSQIVIDGLFLMGGNSKSSAFLEQTCDLTRGVYLAPTGPAQVGGALTEILLSVFLPPIGTRSSLNMPKTNKVDFRARCFDTGEITDLAHVCNQCLSIFQNKPRSTPTTPSSSQQQQSVCPTCQATIVDTSTATTPSSATTTMN